MKRYLFIVNMLLIAAAIYLGVKTFYKISFAGIDDAQFDKAALKAEPFSKDRTVRLLSDYNPIIERNLFNTKKETGGPPKLVDIENLKPTALKLKLLGTVTGDKARAFAVIQDASQNSQNLYRTGDTIQKATLKLILREKVVLQVDGKDEVLEIEKVARSQQTSRSSRTSGRGRSTNISVSRSQITSAVQNINDLMQQVRIRPHYSNGKPDGLRVSNIRPRSLFDNMGLRSGDVITSVDGHNIESVDDALKLYQNLQSAPRVQLQIKRRGRLKTIDYNIE